MTRRRHLWLHLSIGPLDAWRLILNVARFPAPLIEADVAQNDR